MNTESPFTPADVAEILRYVPTRPPYNQWIRVIGAVAAELQVDEAAAVLNAWSPEESPDEYQWKLRSPLKDITIGTLIHMAQEHGFDASAFAGQRAGRLPRRSDAPQPQPKATAPTAPAPAKKLPRYTPRPGSPEELRALASLRRLPSARRLGRDAGRRVPRIHRRPQRH